MTSISRSVDAENEESPTFPVHDRPQSSKNEALTTEDTNPDASLRSSQEDHRHKKRSSKRTKSKRLSSESASPRSHRQSKRFSSEKASPGSQRHTKSIERRTTGPQLIDSPPSANHYHSPSMHPRKASEDGRHNHPQIVHQQMFIEDENYESSEEIMPGALRVGGDPIEEDRSVSEAMSRQAMVEAQVAEDHYDDAVAEALQQGRQEGRQEAIGAAAHLNTRVVDLERDRHRDLDRNIVVAVATTESMNDDASPVKRSIWVYCTFVLLIIILIGGIVGGILLSGKSDTSGNTASPDATFDNPTTNPAIGVLLSTNPTASPTEENLYDPPTLEDCLAIANGTTLDGQQDMTLRSFDIDMDVSLNAGFDVTVGLLHDLEKKLQAFLAPALVGCSESTRLLTNGHDGRILASIKYIIANANVVPEYNSQQPCEADADEPCFRVVVVLSLYLKGDVKLLPLYGLISAKFGDAPLVNTFALQPAFKHIAIVLVSSNDPTNAPSPSPSEVPTTSMAPSWVPSRNPSKAPTEQPTNVLTTAPTEQPTNLPTTAPTEQPTNVPTTVPPTRLPTDQPAAHPTLRPSPKPSPHPTESPTAATEDVPTRRPALLSSKSPTSRPTSDSSTIGSPTTEDEQPTNVPTTAPPTRLPTDRPSTHPTLRPSPKPSLNPTQSPTAATEDDPTSKSPTSRPTSDSSTIGNPTTDDSPTTEDD